jgi:hypothetical protein
LIAASDQVGASHGAKVAFNHVPRGSIPPERCACVGIDLDERKMSESSGF